MADGDLFGSPAGSSLEGPEPGCAYFFALRPKGRVSEQIGHLREAAIQTLGVPQPGRVSDERLHLSLCAPRRTPRLRAPFETSLVRAGDEVLASAFHLRLKGLSRFHGSFDKACVVLRVDEEVAHRAQALNRALAKALFNHGFNWDGSAFAPHVTLFYTDDVELTAEDGVAIDWHVDEFVLIRSWVGLRRHDTLASWPLRVSDRP
ncbi:2'-5' RNA ligase family protein [Dyella kyungheensis]|jgi:2'-5' RNA ligase|uniref:2'-5' RNA ligase family protein n=1 Tax=Dyella kyungheensis TaxID=1242174 RepID=UPI003CFA54D7